MKRQQPCSTVQRIAQVTTTKTPHNRVIQCKAHTHNPENWSEYKTRNRTITTTQDIGAETMMFATRRNEQADELNRRLRSARQKHLETRARQ